MHSGSIAPSLLTSALDENEWPALRSCRFIPRGTSRDTHCTGAWIGPRTSLYGMRKRKTFSPYRSRTPFLRHPVRRLVAPHTHIWNSTLCFDKNVSVYFFFLFTKCKLICHSFESNILMKSMFIPLSPLFHTGNVAALRCSTVRRSSTPVTLREFSYAGELEVVWNYFPIILWWLLPSAGRKGRYEH
jgi:hypothetical protein